MARTKALPSESEPPRAALPRPKSLSDAVYEAVLEKLLSLEIKPEERISVDDLARKLGVSQTPVREALTRLEGQGLIGKVHLVGYRATPHLSKDEFAQLYDARMLLEPHTAGKAAALITDEVLDRMELLLDSIETISPQDGNFVVRVAQVDSGFHRAIAAASGNMVIDRILDQLQVQVQFALLRRHVDLVNVQPATDEHRQILAALRRRDAKAAADLMRRHLAASRNRYWPPNEK